MMQIRRLLSDAFEGEFTQEDWQHTLGGWHIVATARQEVLSHAALIERRLQVEARRFRSGYVEGVATAVDHRGEGLGSSVMRQLEDILRSEFEFGALSTSSTRFYDRLGWERWQGRSFVRSGSDLVRTAGEDDGIMVLRFGKSATVDLHSTIACDERPGDDW